MAERFITPESIKAKAVDVLRQLDGLSYADAKHALEVAQRTMAGAVERLHEEQIFNPPIFRNPDPQAGLEEAKAMHARQALSEMTSNGAMAKQFAESAKALEAARAMGKASQGLAAGAMSAILSKRSASTRPLEQLVQEANCRLRDPLPACTNLSIPLADGASQQAHMPESEWQAADCVAHQPVKRVLPSFALGLLVLALLTGGRK